MRGIFGVVMRKWGDGKTDIEDNALGKDFVIFV